NRPPVRSRHRPMGVQHNFQYVGDEVVPEVDDAELTSAFAASRTFMGLPEGQTIEWHHLGRAARLADAESSIRSADVDTDQSPLPWGAKSDARIALDELRRLGSEVTRKREPGGVLAARSPRRRPLRPFRRRDKAEFGL